MDQTENDVELCRYVVAGVAVACPWQLPGLATTGFRDGEVLVRLVDRSRSETEDWLSVPVDAPVTIQVRTDGGTLEVAAAEPLLKDITVAVRSAVPFAAALQGKVTLHAAGVGLGGGVAAVVGASGAGKSTLAGALRAAGLTVVADDLLPCRLRGGQVDVPAPPDASGNHRLVTLVRVFFLRRRSDLDEPVVKRLGKRGCFEQLIRQGFGELAETGAWRAQVDVYHHIADRVPTFEMTIPDDLERVAEVARWFEMHYRREIQ